jgi:hypothetical protein
MEFFRIAPGAAWAAIITFLALFGAWLSDYFGAEPWVAPVAGFLIAVLVPVLKLIAQATVNGPDGYQLRHYGDHTGRRSLVNRWLF